MQERFRYRNAYPDAYKALLALSQAVEKTGLAPQLNDLVNYRVSQLNGCAFCLDMHSKDLRARGETEQRLYMISAWREAPHLYSDRERAALAWAEMPAMLLCAGLRATTAVLSRFWDWRAVSPFEDLSGELVITVRPRRSIFSLTPWGLPTGAARQMRGLEAAGNPAIGALASLIPARSWS